MFDIEYSANAKQFLNGAEKHILRRIMQRIERLKDMPVPSDAKFIERKNGDKIFRLRIGDYRALYKVDEKKEVVLVMKKGVRNRQESSSDLVIHLSRSRVFSQLHRRELGPVLMTPERR